MCISIGQLILSPTCSVTCALPVCSSQICCEQHADVTSDRLVLPSAATPGPSDVLFIPVIVTVHALT